MRSLFYIVILLVITSCSYSTSRFSRGLDEAQLLMTDNPAAAMEKLNGYDVTQFSDSATMARWALLYSEAMVANRLKAPTDTIVNIAVEYYGNHNFAKEYEKARRLKTELVDVQGSDALATALYLQKEKEFMLYKEQTKRRQLLFGGITVLIIAAGIILWQRQRIKLKQSLNESLIAEASSLKTSLASHHREYSALESRLSASLANRFGIIDELCETYYESQGTKTERKALVEKVKAQIESLKSDSGIFSEMEDCNRDLLNLFKEDFPSVKPDEYRLMVYLASGLSNRTIALLIGESIDTAYKRKSRLKHRILSSTTPHQHIFLSKF